MDSIEGLALYGIIPVLMLYAGGRLRAALATRSERRCRGREVLALAALTRSRLSTLKDGVVARIPGIPTDLYEQAADVTAKIGVLAVAVDEALDAAEKAAATDPSAARRKLGRATRVLKAAERLLETRNANLKDAALELRCAVRRNLSDAMAAQAFVARRVESFRRAGCRVAVEAARLHMIGNALKTVRPLIIKDVEAAQKLLEEQVKAMRDLSRVTARKIALTKRVRDISAAFPPVIARTRSCVFSVMRMRLDLDPRVDRDTAQVIRQFDTLLAKAEAMMAHAEKRLASGAEDIEGAADEALRAFNLAIIVEGRVIAAMEATTVKTAEGEPLRRPTILH